MQDCETTPFSVQHDTFKENICLKYNPCIDRVYYFQSYQSLPIEPTESSGGIHEIALCLKRTLLPANIDVFMLVLDLLPFAPTLGTFMS